MEIDVAIANIHIKFIGDLHETFLKRILPYKIKSKLRENILVECKVTDFIYLPQNAKIIKKDRDRTWFYDENGAFCYADYNEQIKKYVMLTKIGITYVLICVYSFKMSDEIELINDALKIYKTNMPNPKESLNATNAKFDPAFPLINSTDWAMRIALLNYNILSIHSSAISYDGEGIIFSAPSGTGKSTHTELWLKHSKKVKILNDDLPFLSFNNDEITLYGAPWAGSSGINTNAKAPLKAIVFLRQSPENKIEKLATISAIQYITKELLIPCDRRYVDVTYTLLNLLLSSVPCYLLDCKPDMEAVLTVKNEIFK